MITLIKTSLSLTDPIRVTSALFYREDGTVDSTPILVDEDSWKEIAPYVHTLHVDDDLDRPSTALSTFSTHSGTVGATNDSVASGTSNGKGSGLNSNASAFVPSPNGMSIKTGEKVTLQGLRKSSFSPACKSRLFMRPDAFVDSLLASQPTSPFSILDNTGSCV